MHQCSAAQLNSDWRVSLDRPRARDCVDCYSPILFEANINGRGMDHCETIANRFNAMKGYPYGYWNISWNSTNNALPVIRSKHGTPYLYTGSMVV